MQFQRLKKVQTIRLYSNFLFNSIKTNTQSSFFDGCWLQILVDRSQEPDFVFYFEFNTLALTVIVTSLPVLRVFEVFDLAAFRHAKHSLIYVQETHSEPSEIISLALAQIRAPTLVSSALVSHVDSPAEFSSKVRKYENCTVKCKLPFTLWSGLYACDLTFVLSRLSGNTVTYT